VKLKAVIFFYFALSCITAFPQEAQVKIDTTKSQKKKPNFRPASLRIGTDLYALGKSQFKKGFSGWELTADTEIYRYLLTADYGHSAETVASDSGSTYANNGNFWRIGIDANFLTRDEDKNVFLIGLHYGQSSYDEKMVVTAPPLFGDQLHYYDNRNMKASWFELTTGLKVKIWKGIWLGQTARYKFGLKDDDTRAMLSHIVPGYGRTNKESTWGFNYYIFYRIPFRPTTSILPPKKKK
jgi:hypothetical protein